MLHISKIYNLVERSTPDKGRIPFNITYVTEDGSLRKYNNVICTSSHFRPASINIQKPNGDIRKLSCIGIVEINGNEIFM